MGEEATTGPVPAETTPQSSIDLVPVLQIVHVTDLHVKEASANPIAVLSKGIRLRARFAQRLQRHGWFGWEEGTQGHLPRAPRAFERFLKSWRADHPKWLDVPVWLVDTGDRTAFGDQASIESGGRMLREWADALGGCPIMRIPRDGGHDSMLMADSVPA